MVIIRDVAGLHNNFKAQEFAIRGKLQLHSDFSYQLSVFGRNKKYNEMNDIN